MDIKLFEIKKVFTSPSILVLILLFITFNLFIVFEHRGMREELLTVTHLVDLYGVEINENMIQKIEKDYEVALQTVKKLSSERASVPFQSAGEFFEIYYQNETLFSEEEKSFFTEIVIIENYLHLVKDIDEVYEGLNIMGVAEGEIAKYQLSGQAAQTVRRNYSQLENRVASLIENNEHKHLFFIGKIYGMHSLLFKQLFSSMIYQIMILVVLTTAFLTNYEFESKTQLLMYSTKRGRRLAIDKLTVSLLSTVAITSSILLPTLLAFFSMFNYKGLWHVPISNFFNWEPPLLPYISWWNLSFLQFLLCTILVVYVASILFSAITFIISIFIKNSYLVFFIFVILFGVSLLAIQFFPRDGILIFITAFTPFVLIINPSVWFMESGAFTTFKYYEVITLCSWLLLLFILSLMSYKKFTHEEIN
ncbi:hypothetical protein [Bacillus alkalicellulosilyticus]|uniref:hypothetical protein n=1 Tax=Alkalihalobacterium alkalicellulosilyticum TaxID=1912214 RepID=UPI000997D855|nr:hypothetical protein [Bacillus alkalicellulosilyticus]